MRKQPAAKEPPKVKDQGTAWTGLVLIGVLLLLLAVVALNTMHGLERAEALMIDSLATRGATMVRALEAAARVGMRGGPRGQWRLQGLAEEMAADPNVRSIAILAPDGSIIAAFLQTEPGGKVSALGDLPPEIKTQVQQGKPLAVFVKRVMVVGRPFNPLRHFRSRAEALRAYAAMQKRHQGMGMGPGHMGGGHHMHQFFEEMLRGPGSGQRPAYALVRLSTPEFEATRRRALRHAFVLAGFIFLGAGAVAAVMLGLARRRGREVARLREEVARSQHLAALGRLAGSVAHEVRNPLSALRGLVQLLGKRHEAGSPEAEYSRVAISEVDRLERVVSGLLEYTRPRPPRRFPLDLAESAQRTLELLHDDPRADGVTMALKSRPGLPQVSADPDQVRQVLLNLVINALEALDGRGRVDVEVAAADGLARVTVSDSGPGLPPGDAEQVFDPFFSTRERGTGLGLAIARQVAQAHGGDLKAGPAPPDLGGARFELTLPLDGEKK